MDYSITQTHPNKGIINFLNSNEKLHFYCNEQISSCGLSSNLEKKYSCSELKSERTGGFILFKSLDL